MTRLCFCFALEPGSRPAAWVCTSTPNRPYHSFIATLCSSYLTSTFNATDCITSSLPVSPEADAILLYPCNPLPSLPSPTRQRRRRPSPAEHLSTQTPARQTGKQRKYLSRKPRKFGSLFEVISSLKIWPVVPNVIGRPTPVDMEANQSLPHPTDALGTRAEFNRSSPSKQDDPA